MSWYKNAHALGLRIFSATAVMLGAIPVVSGQEEPDLVTPPANILLSNSNSVPLGPYAGLEGSAYVARAGDPSAAWLNPAGLSRAQATELSGSAGVFQLTTVSPSTLPESGGSVDRVPSLVGFMVAHLFGGNWTAGLAVATVSSWRQSTDSEIVVDHGGVRERFGYSADSRYEQFVGAGSVGFVSGKWRAGGGLAFVQTSVQKDEVVSDRLVDSTRLRSILIDSRASGSAFHLRPLFGVQYDASPHVQLGVVVRTPAIRLFSSGSYSAEGLAALEGSTQGASFLDSSARFSEHLPFEVRGGVAYVAPRFELEVDFQGQTAISSYSMLSSDQAVITYKSGSGTAPVIETEPFQGFNSHSRAIGNVSVGGHVVLTSSGAWRLHFGAETDISPVGTDEEVFTKVNLYGWTAGVSGTKGRFQFSVGLNDRFGSSDDIFVRNLGNGEPVQSGIHVRNIGIIYAVNYKF